MKTHDQAQEVSPRWMQKMMNECDPGGYMRDADELAVGLPPVKPGDQVKIVDGPFAGLITQVAALEGLDQVCVELEMFGGTRPVTIARQGVEPVA